MKLIVCLGNPGEEYFYTRHNVGFLFADYFAKKTGVTFSNDTKKNLLYAKHADYHIIKPLTYMNLSGEAVQKYTSYYNIKNEDIVVIYDDKDLPFETVRFRSKGTAGGHRGIQSIIVLQKTADIARIKIGVDSSIRKEQGIDTARFVLSAFSREEQEILPSVFANVEGKLFHWISE